MRKEDLQQFLNKKIRLYLINDMHYSGRIDSVNDNSVIIIDKFGNLVTIVLGRISHIEEIKKQKENGDGFVRKN